jgi:hypothetical protein
MNLTSIELAYLVAAFAVLTRGTLDGGITTQEAGIVAFLIGLIPVRRADKKNGKNDNE